MAFQVLLIIIMFISLGVLMDSEKYNPWSGVILCAVSMVAMFGTLLWL